MGYGPSFDKDRKKKLNELTFFCKVFWNSYIKLERVEFEPITTMLYYVMLCGIYLPSVVYSFVIAQ